MKNLTLAVLLAGIGASVGIRDAAAHCLGGLLGDEYCPGAGERKKAEQERRDAAIGAAAVEKHKREAADAATAAGEQRKAAQAEADARFVGEASQEDVDARQQQLQDRMDRESRIFTVAGAATPDQRFGAFKGAKLDATGVLAYEKSYKGALDEAVSKLVLPTDAVSAYSDHGSTDKILGHLADARNLKYQPAGKMQATLATANEQIAREQKDAEFASARTALNAKFDSLDRLVTAGARTKPSIGDYGSLRGNGYTDPSKGQSGPPSLDQLRDYSAQLDGFRERGLAAVNEALPKHLQITPDMLDSDDGRKTVAERLDMLDRHHEAVMAAIKDRKYDSLAKAREELKGAHGLGELAAAPAVPAPIPVVATPGAPAVASPADCPGGKCPVAAAPSAAEPTELNKKQIAWAQKRLFGSDPYNVDGIEGKRTAARVKDFVTWWNTHYIKKHGGESLAYTDPKSPKLTPEIMDAIGQSEKELRAARQQQAAARDPWQRERQAWRQRDNAYRQWYDSPPQNPLDLVARFPGFIPRAGMAIVDPYEERRYQERRGW